MCSMASTTSRSEVDEEKYFFGKITSTEANAILLKDGSEDGTFLVRESCSSPGNYVLSIISENNPVHLLIQKYKEDAFFSLVIPGESPPVLHGIDNLVNHYSQHPIGPSSTTLNRPCVGESLPAKVRLHGSSSLLHRATAQCNVMIVREMLKSTCKRIDDKDNNGQTALHIACAKGFTEIVGLLVNASADVEVRDEEGLTALHLASRYDRPDIIRILVEVGHADIQARASRTDDVALHEAAASGTLACVRKLLALGAPSCPRNRNLETPGQLARSAGHMACFDMLVNHRARRAGYELKDYYHGPIDRHGAQERLSGAPNARSGHFLLRKSARKHSTYVLTLLYDGQIYNFEMNYEGSNFCLDNGPYFASMDSLISHYMRFEDGLPCRLQTPVAPSERLPPEDLPRLLQQNNAEVINSDSGAGSIEQQVLLTSMSQEDITSSVTPVKRTIPDIQISSPVSGSQELNQDLIDLHSPARANSSSISPSRSVSHENLQADLQGLALRKPETARGLASHSPTMDGNRTNEIFGDIDVKSLSIGSVLGNGEFGSVLKGVWHSPSGDQIEVAVKILHENDKVNKKNFLKEADVMMNLNHLYIVKLIGICHGPPVAMVQELMAMGSLLDFLLENPDQISIDFHLKLWAAQIAEGMQYLEQKRFVHCDLAARNILLSSKTLAKISDFGLSRAVGVNEDYYSATQGGKWPLKWCAPESIHYGTFTHRSDVWSYGITLWEMYTFGDQPYGDLPGHRIVELIEQNERLPAPEKCPRGVFELMLRCWNFNPKDRPSFRELATIFRTKPEYINIKHYFK